MSTSSFFLSTSLCLGLAACRPASKVGDTATGTRDGGTADGGVAVDADGDGYTVAQGDCDDGDGDIHPGASDLVGDDIDNNCDGIDGIDADGDGIASLASGGTDCDDGDETVHPGATETWYDGLDQDCDGASDYDADADGYDADSYDGADCDDGDPAIHPGATETWYDGVDQDCEGASDYDADTDGYDTEGYGGSDCDDGDAAVNPGAIDICGNGIDEDCSGSVADCTLPSMRLSDASAIYTQATDGDLAGFSLSGAGDVNGDGYDDIIVGSPYNPNYMQRGAAYLLLGSASPGSRKLVDADAEYNGEQNGDQAGYAVSAAGDVNGDGYDDLLVGTRYNDDSESDAGAAYLVLGGASPTSLRLDGADAIFTGVAASDCAGTALASAGDVNGDGYDDMLIGALCNDEAGANAGATYLVLGSERPASASLADADAEFTGEAGDDYSGNSVAGAGDVDGDGYEDMIIGAPDNSDVYDIAGAAYLVLGSAAPTSASLSDADAVYLGAAYNEGAGYAVSSAGDVNADGYDDMLVGAPRSSEASKFAGRAYLVLGSAAPASSSLAYATAIYDGEAANDRAGLSVSGAGDVDGDGYDDMLVAAPWKTVATYSAGAVYLVLGGTAPASAPLSTTEPWYIGVRETGLAGYAVSGAGDVDGDGAPDLLIGAPFADRAYLLLTPGP